MGGFDELREQITLLKLKQLITSLYNAKYTLRQN